MALLLLGSMSQSQAGDPNKFYFVADANNRLYSVDRVTMDIVNIGPTGVSSIEAISYWPEPGANILYATNAGTFGTLDTNTGAFTEIGEVDGGGTANGALGPQTLNDVDGLAFDGQTGKLWASERNDGAGNFDLLFQINKTTGRFVPNAFGLGVDYLVVDGVGLFEDIDDIAFNPRNTRIFANSNIGGNNDLLIEINKFTGLVTPVTSLSEDDVEGMSVHNDGMMYGSEGDDTRMSLIDPSTGVMSNAITLQGGDVEALAALVADASIYKGRVYDDANVNGVDDSETGISGVTVQLYIDTDSNGLWSASDILIQTTTTDGSGNYQFVFATVGYLVSRVNLSSVPSGYALSTDNLESASFLDTSVFGELDSLNDYGLASGADSDGDGIPDFYEGTTTDTDGDGVNNHLDLDSDDDGILDSVEHIEDTDGDGIADYLDLDSDNDGISDAIEANGGINPTNYDASTGRITGADGDGDGLKTAVDNAPATAYGAGSTSTHPEPDTDHDGVVDYLDLDSDNDGIMDIVEGGGVDSDGDALIDGFLDAGSDGFHDAAQSSPYNILNSDSAYEASNAMELKANYRDSDSDNDGIDDTREGQTTSDYAVAILDTDSDGDGIVDYWDSSVGGTSIDPNDHDGDGLDDYVDDDSDNDGVSDFIEGNDANQDGIADVGLLNVDADSNGIDDALDGSCELVTVSVRSSSHGEQQGTSVDISSSDLELTREDAEQTVGIYFPSIAIDQGVNISDAYIQFETDESGFTGTVNLTLHGELALSSSTFTTSSNNVTNRTPTVSSTDWTITNQWTPVGSQGTDQQTPSVAGILEEITGQSGWESGNAISFIIARNGAGSTRRTAEDDPVLFYTAGDYIFAAHGCASSVAVQNSDGDLESDFRDTDDDGDGVLTANEDYNNNLDWSDDFTQGGGSTPDYLTPNACAGGLILTTDSTYAIAVTQEDGIASASNALGAPDAAGAELYDTGDTLVLELQNTVTAGNNYSVYFKHRNYSSGLSGGATLRIMESTDNVNYTAQPSQPSTFSLVNYVEATFTAQVNTRFIKIYNPGTNPDFDVDAAKMLRSSCQEDSDGDGIADLIDLDDDNDGVPDLSENTTGLEPMEDDDEDGIPNYQDADFCTLNSNGVCASLDFDGDGNINQLDLDADNDGITDILEAGGTDANQDGEVDYPTPGDPSTMVDADNDGLADEVDNVNSGSGSGEVTSGTGLTNANTDGEGSVDILDIDADDDGIVDNVEAQTTAGYIAPLNTDTDGDGLDDAYDPDNGGTYIIPVNTEGTGNPDYTDTDTDDDGEADDVEGHDTDGDGTADAGSAANTGVSGGTTDADGDGLLDGFDNNTSDRDPTNGSLTANSHPNVDEGGTERDWREVPCSGGDVTLSTVNATTNASSYCVQDGWTYYYNPADSTELLFAIEHMPTSGNTNDFSVSIDLTVSSDPSVSAGVFSNEDVGNERATFVMGRYWNINLLSGSLNGAVNVRFFYDTDDADAMENTADQWNTDNAGGTSSVSGRRWFTMNSGSFDPGSPDLQADGISGSSELFPAATGTEDGVSFVQFNGLSNLTGGTMAYSVGTNSTVLPIELLSFRAFQNADNVDLEWATATEVNSDHFKVLRSANGETWDEIGRVEAAGQSQVLMAYRLVDRSPLPGISYYRLKAVDIDESYELSNIEPVRFKASETQSLLRVYPNPGNGFFRAELPTSQDARFLVFNSTGQLVGEHVHLGGATAQLPFSHLSAGTYFLKVVYSTGQQEHLQLIIQK